MGSIWTRSLAWSPTIAMSWLWGLGFFYAMHVTLAHGWLGFLSFASVNVAGLFLFGYALGAPGVDPLARLNEVGARFTSLFILSQILAVALTLYGLAVYAFMPLGLPAGPAIAATAVVALIGCALGQGASLPQLTQLHRLTMIVGVGAALAAIPTLRATGGAPAPLIALDERFYGMVVPSLVGFLLGPWTDIQQWRRAAAIRAAGLSPRIAYGGGAALFFGLLCLNAALAGLAGTGFGAAAMDGVVGHQGAVAQALARPGAGLAAGAFLLWAALAAVSTLDSAYDAIKWRLAATTARSASPLLALIPNGLIASPLWIFAAAAATAAGLAAAGLSQLYLMAPYATLLVGATLGLIAAVHGLGAAYDGLLNYLLGWTALLLFLIGYMAPNGALEMAATLVAMIGAWPAAALFFGWTKPAAEAGEAKSADAPAPAPQPAPTRAMPQVGESYVYTGFDDRWFVLHLQPTYDDTNSVGNVYFANYIRWVGKARELFFNHCMPDFDLKTTPFYILTHSLKHDFRREAKEFESITVKIRISQYNRKFVELEHEIYSDSQGLLGRGAQSLMFADSKTYALVDFPRPVIEGFMPYLPKAPPASLYAPEAPESSSAAAK
ncbi:MAG: acyl-CoA thioesterase [Methylobacteriaceae bacterium]|nr:acyl-CoA thioesterase [Methylobacteriaceae bacterium]